MTTTNLGSLPVLDKRLIKGRMKVAVHEYIRANWKYLLGLSQKAAEQITIGEPAVKEVLLLTGSIEVEDRKLVSSYEQTSEKETRPPQDTESDIFKYQATSDPTRERYVPLPNRDAIVVCHNCGGTKETVQDCSYCSGEGKVPCDSCQGRGYQKVLCWHCRGDEKKNCETCHNTRKINERCNKCYGKGITETPCPKCENGKIKVVCTQCQGKGLLLKKASLWIRTQPIVIEPPIPLKSEERFPTSLTDTTEQIYISPPLSLDDLRAHSNPLPTDVWELVIAGIKQACWSITQASKDTDYKSHVKSVQARVLRANVAQAMFQYKDRVGRVWVSLGNDGQPIRPIVVPFPLRFADFATELLALAFSFLLGAALSWYFGNLLPFLTVGLAGVFLILALRLVEWRSEHITLLVKWFLGLTTFLGVIAILTLFIQSIGKGQLDSQAILAMTALAAMIAFTIAGIRSDQIGKFFIDFVDMIYKK